MNVEGNNMDIEILEETKNKIHFKVKGEDHTILNLLKEELWKDNNVKAAAYRMDHPLIGIPEMTVEVTQGNDPRKAIKDAVKRIEKSIEKLKTEFKAQIK
jgi:DNA-directed RNA polymerase subunit L